MKKILLLALFIANLGLDAQFSCGTKERNMDEWLHAYDHVGGRPELDPKKVLQSRAMVYIPMHYHVVTKDDGTGDIR